MNQHAEYVSPGHPDRLADAIAESIVTAAVRQKPDALVGVEVAVHTDCVFVDGRIAAGSRPIEIEKIVRDVYRAAGYGGSWNPDPGKIRVTTELCQEVLSAEESDIRPFSDDQNIVIGYACGDERTNYLPSLTGSPANSAVASSRACGADADLSATFGPDFKILSSLSVAPGATQVEWHRLILSIQHIPEAALRAAAPDPLPILEQILRELENGRTKRSSFELRLGKTSPQWGRGICHRRPRGGQRAFGKETRYRSLRAGRPNRRRGACGQGSAQGGQVRRAAGPAIGQKTYSRRGGRGPRDLWAGRREVMRRSLSRHQLVREG